MVVLNGCIVILLFLSVMWCNWLVVVFVIYSIFLFVFKVILLVMLIFWMIGVIVLKFGVI